MTGTSRNAVAVLLPAGDRDEVSAELIRGGFNPVPVTGARDLVVVLAERDDVVAAIIDMEDEPEHALAAWSLLHTGGIDVPALLVVDPATIDSLDLTGPGHEEDEYVTRPLAPESMRWRLEAMRIRREAGAGPESSHADQGWARRGELVLFFNPKGGVGKTLIATNLAAALVARGKKVLLVDADTVTGHVPVSLGMDGVGSVVDAWFDEVQGGPSHPFPDLASDHASGLRVLPLTTSPIDTDLLDPDRVANGIAAARRTVEFVIVDMHPGYTDINRAVFDQADRIFVPVTPDLPAIRAVVKLRDVAEELGMRGRLALVVNRAGTGVPVADIEKTVGIPVYATIRSAGLTIVRATNEGRTLVDIAPKEGVTHDFEAFADRILGIQTQPKAAFRLFGRQAPARA